MATTSEPSTSSPLPALRTSSPLSELPAEIRRKIYNYALNSQRPIHLALRREYRQSTTVSNLPMRPSVNALSHTCRTFYLESTPTFYGTNVFRIAVRDLKAFIKAVQPIHIKTMRNLNVQGLNNPTYPLDPRFLKRLAKFTGLRVLHLSDTSSNYSNTYAYLHLLHVSVNQNRYLQRIVDDVRFMAELRTIHVRLTVMRPDLGNWARRRYGFLGVPGWAFELRIAENRGKPHAKVAETLRKVHGPLWPVKERGGETGDAVLEEGMLLFTETMGEV